MQAPPQFRMHAKARHKRLHVPAMTPHYHQIDLDALAPKLLKRRQGLCMAFARLNGAHHQKAGALRQCSQCLRRVFRHTLAWHRASQISP